MVRAINSKAVNEVAVTNTVAGFQDILAQARLTAINAEQEVKAREDYLNEAKNLQRAKDTEYNRLRKIDRLAVCTGDNEPYMWHTNMNPGREWDKTAWSEYSIYRTAIYEFTVTIKERTDLKKMKWETKVYGTKTSPGDKLYNGSEYMEAGYVRIRYIDSVLEAKFSSEAAAREWLKQWQVRLVIDHEEEIIQERMLVELAKARPRIKVGSIVEHEVYGRGKVLANIHGERWTVKFEGNPKFKDLLKHKDLEPRPAEEENLKLIQE